MQGFISALKDLYKSNKLDFPNGWDREIGRVLDGYCKLIASLKASGKYSVREGKVFTKYNFALICLQNFAILMPGASVL